MIPRRYWTPPLIGSLALATVALAATLIALRNAVQRDPLPVPEPARAVPRTGEVMMADAPVADAVALAVAHDPFRAERRPAPERFRLPGEGSPAAMPTSAAALPPSPVTLIGTAVVGDGGFAMCQRGADAPKLVRVGETYGDLMLRSVQPGRAVFRAKDGATLELRVSKAGA